MNYSKQREIIYETLKSNACHPDAEQIWRLLSQKESNISLATVYRNLNAMAQLGRINKIEGLEEKAHFDHNTHEHHHFMCKNCRRIFDIENEAAPDIIEKTQDLTGFQIDRCNIVFSGLCPECKKDR